MSHLFQIPPTGFFHLYQSEEEGKFDREYIHKIITQYNGPTPIQKIATIDVKRDDQTARLHFVPDSLLEPNPRARLLIATIFGWHMIFYGNVVIDGLTPNQIEEFIKDQG